MAFSASPVHQSVYLLCGAFVDLAFCAVPAAIRHAGDRDCLCSAAVDLQYLHPKEK